MPGSMTCSCHKGFRQADLKVDGSLEGYHVVKHAMLQVVHDRLISPDAIGHADHCPAGVPGKVDPAASSSRCLHILQ